MTVAEITALLKPSLEWAARSAIWQLNKYLFSAREKKFFLINEKTMDQPIAEVLGKHVEAIGFVARASMDDFGEAFKIYDDIDEKIKQIVIKAESDLSTIEIKKKKLLKKIAAHKKSYNKQVQELKQIKRRECAGINKKLRIVKNKFKALEGLIDLYDVKYPLPPEPIIPATESGEGLPEISGVYFVWKDGIIVYIGQSVNISNRCNSRGHGKIFKGDQLSYLPFNKVELNHVEAFYIGVCRPVRNGAVR